MEVAPQILVEEVLIHATQEESSTGEDEPIDQDELVNKRKLVMQELLRDAEAAKRRRRDLQKWRVRGCERHEAEVMEDLMCIAGRDSFMIVLKK